MLADGVVVAKRNLIKIKRVPELLVFVLISPIMFVLLFAYVFGNSIEIPGGVATASSSWRGSSPRRSCSGPPSPAPGMAEDMQKGIIDRFRSLPMSRSAVLLGRTAATSSTTCCRSLIMSITGLLVGWRIRGSLVDAVVGFLLILAFAYAFSWVMALVGLIVPSVEVINNASFMVIFPVTFIANTFVPIENFPARSRPSPSGTRSRRSPRRRASCSATSPGRAEPARGRCGTRSPTP